VALLLIKVSCSARACHPNLPSIELTAAFGTGFQRIGLMPLLSSGDNATASGADYAAATAATAVATAAELSSAAAAAPGSGNALLMQ